MKLLDGLTEWSGKRGQPGGLRGRYRKPRVAYAGHWIWYFAHQGRIHAGDTVEVRLPDAKPVPAIFPLEVRQRGFGLVVDVPGSGITDLKYLELRLRA